MEENSPDLLRSYAQKRSQSAFATFVRRHFDAVYSAALRRCSGRVDLAKDVTQEVFIKAAQHAAQLSRHPVPSAWLHMTTRNSALNLLRAETRRRVREQEAQAMQDTPSFQEQENVWTELAPILDQSIDSLSEKDRRALLLRFFDQQSFAEIAGALSLSEDAARMRVDRALEKLRRVLSRHRIATSASTLGVVLGSHTVSAAPAGVTFTAIPTVLKTAATTQLASPSWLEVNGLAFPATAALVSFLVTGAAWINFSRAQTDSARIRLTEEKEIALLEKSIRLLDIRQSSPATQATSSSQTPQRHTAAPPQPIKLAVSTAPSEEDDSPGSRLGGGRRLFLSAAYEPLYRALALDPEEIQSFEDLCLQGPNTGLWLSSQASDQSNAATQPEPTPSEINTRLAALLGPDGFEKLQSFNRTVPARSFAAQLAGAVYLSDPLSQETAAQLSQAIAQSSSSYQKGGPVTLHEVNWDQVLLLSQSHLSAAQQNALVALRAQQAFEHALAMKSARIRQ
ncbi:MAG: sigma-70 family RNA polymerase sigma factor [Nibricoccus sp.]